MPNTALKATEWTETTLDVRTPENVEFAFELAGIGTRAIAVLVDTLIRGSAWLIFISMIALVFGAIPFESLGPWLVIAFLLFFLAINYSYFILFEYFWNGQTPGKRLMKIRVVRDGGYPIELTDSIVRNLIRFIDELPHFVIFATYGFGITSAFISKKHKRLGDFFAGTIVVKERSYSLDPYLKPPETETVDLSPELRRAGAARLRLTAQEYEMITHFLNRAYGFDAGTRYRIGYQIALPLMQRAKMDDIDIKNYIEQGKSYESFLSEIASAHGRGRRK